MTIKPQGPCNKLPKKDTQRNTGKAYRLKFQVVQTTWKLVSLKEIMKLIRGFC